LDAQGEKAEFKSPNLAGVQDILQIHQGDLCAAAGFPEERLFGRTSAGLNSNSDGLTHYYDRIRARRTEEILPLALSIAQAMMACSQGPTGGQTVPLAVQFPPVATPSPKDQADTDYKQAQTDALYMANGVATVEQVQARTRARYG
jgi:phage-related protein (TIGR01555 family)